MTRVPSHSVPHFILLAAVAVLAAMPSARARQWHFKGVAKPVEGEFEGEAKGYVVLRGANGKSFELPLASFAPGDQDFIKALSAKPSAKVAAEFMRPPAGAVARAKQSLEAVGPRLLALDKPGETVLTSAADPFDGGWVAFTHPEAWLVFENVRPDAVISKYLDRMLVNGAPAVADGNVRVVEHAWGTVVIPQPPDIPALAVFRGANAGGASVAVKCYEKCGQDELDTLKGPPGSFVLRRGYMATLAENGDGTGASRNYVAQDRDVVISALPKGLDKGIGFIRVFPWRWTSKKGIAGGIHQNINVGWFYDWNIGASSTPDLEYVAIKQKRYWPGMDQDWRAKGISHLLGFNEPDRPDQAKMTVDEAIGGWPELMRTGLRLGSPAPSDGGLAWLYDFIAKADRAGLRVDFVAVHYYRGVGDAGDAKGAARQMRDFLQAVHDRVKRPVWITEWNNGANWTNTPEPNEKQQKAAIAEMIRMLDDTPFVERYALYNWVKDGRKLVRDDGSLTPAGEVYRDDKSPVFYTQPRNYK